MKPGGGGADVGATALNLLLCFRCPSTWAGETSWITVTTWIQSVSWTNVRLLRAPGGDEDLNLCCLSDGVVLVDPAQLKGKKGQSESFISDGNLPGEEINI